MSRRDFEKIIVRTLAEQGVHEYEFAMRGKHRECIFLLKGKRYSYVYPNTASDYRGAMNARAFIRRLFRGTGNGQGAHA